FNACNIYIRNFRPVLSNNFQCLLNLCKSALTKDIKFKNTGILGNNHIKLYGRESLWGHVSSRIIVNRLFQDKYPCGMYAQVVWEIFNKLTITKYQFRNFV